MKFLVSIPTRKSSLVYIGRRGDSFIEVHDGTEVELSQDEMVKATGMANGAVMFSPVFVKAQEAPRVESERKASK